MLFDADDEALEDSTTWQSTALREACAVSQSPQLTRDRRASLPEGDPALPDERGRGPRQGRRVKRRGEPGPFIDPVRIGSESGGGNRGRRRYRARTGRHVLHGSRPGDARCDLATALVEHLDKATLAPLAKGLVGALVEPCLRGAPQDGRDKARFLGGARAAASILRTCASGGSCRRPTKLCDRADDVHESVHSAARLALNAFDRLFLRDDEALRKQGADLLNSVLPSLRPAPDAVDEQSERLSLLDFVAKAASHLPTDYAASETYVDDAQARLDGALQSAADARPRRVPGSDLRGADERDVLARGPRGDDLGKTRAPVRPSDRITCST